MKIGILTYHWVYNFGANLQTLSTIGYLKRKGHDPIVINWVPEDSEQLYNESTSKEQIVVFKQFQKEFYPLTRLCRNAKEVASVIEENGIEMVFEGADTLFMLRKPTVDKNTGNIKEPYSDMTFPNPFWGEYLNYCAVPVVGFSIATLQTDAEDFPEIAKEAGRYLKRFSKLTVRDVPTQKLVESFTEGAFIPEITPDPVFAFNDNVVLDDDSILKPFELPSEYYLLCIPEPYNERMEGWVKEFNSIMLENGKVVYELPRQTGTKCFDIKQLNHTNISPIEWYVLLKHSAGYIGGLMHPIVTCIHNEVPFYAIDYYGIQYHMRYFHRYVRINTSKTYQIIKECGLTNLYGHIRGLWKKVDSPERVYKKVTNPCRSALMKASLLKKRQLLSALKGIIS